MTRSASLTILEFGPAELRPAMGGCFEEAMAGRFRAVCDAKEKWEKKKRDN